MGLPEERTSRTASLRNSGGYGGLVLGTSSPLRGRSLPSLYLSTEVMQSHYDLRTNAHFTLKQNPLRRHHLDEFVEVFNPENRRDRKPTWSEASPEGRWRRYDYEELLKRDKTSVDLFWLKDDSLEDAAHLPEPDVIAVEMAEDLQSALEQFATIADDLKSG